MTLRLSLPLLMLALTACNGDLFVERTALSTTEVTLDGDGGVATVSFQPKGLQSMLLDPYSTSTYITYFDGNGISIDPSRTADIRRINYTSTSNLFDIYVEGNRLRIESTENTYTGNGRIHTLRLSYGYATESITITLNPGQPMRFVGAEFGLDSITTVEQARSSKQTITYGNEGNSWLHVGSIPFVVLRNSVVLHANTLATTPVSVPMLERWSDGSWSVADSMLTVIPGQTARYESAAMSSEVRFDHTIPPRTKRSYICNVVNASASLPTRLTFENPVSGRRFMTSGLCLYYVPKSYETTYQDTSY
jgi:hypothetical protein